MVKNSEEPRKSRGLIFPLYANILTLFLVVVLSVAGGLTYFNYHSSAERTTMAARQLMKDIAERVVHKTMTYPRPAWAMAGVIASMPEVGARPSETTHPLRDTLIKGLEAYAQFYSIQVGYDDGEVIQVVSLEGLNAEVRARMKAPAAARYGVRAVRRVDGAGTRIQVWTFLDQDHLVVSQLAPAPATFDPRVSQWYQRAKVVGRPQLSDKYLFESTQQSGATVAQRFASAPDGRGGVVAIDLNFAKFSKFLETQKVTSGGLTFLFDANRRLYAHPQDSKSFTVQRIKGRTVLTRVPVSELGDPVLDQLMHRFRPGLKEQYHTFDVAGETYVTGVVSGTVRSGQTTNVALLAPMKELLAPIIRSTLDNLLVSILAILLTVPLIILTAWRISRPLGKVVEETTRIRNFDLSPAPPIRTHIAEIHRLTRSVATMKTTLRAFSQYVPKALVRQLIRSGVEQRIGGEKRALTLLFSDVAGYTDMAEAMPPEELVVKTSNYFEALCEVILANHGTIDKFIGDAIMAFWNAPTEDADHVHHACVAMLLCRESCHQMNQAWQAAGQPPMPTRLGLHTGEAVVGNVGSADRMDYTAIGATVNLASRLEGLNKYYGTELLVSQAVRDATGEAFLMRQVDRVQPKGTNVPVNIYELRAMRGGDPALEPTAEEETYCRSWQESFEHYLQRHWSTALEGFTALSQRDPEDQAARVLMERTTRYLETPPADDWNGARTFTTK